MGPSSLFKVERDLLLQGARRREAALFAYPGEERHAERLSVASSSDRLKEHRLEGDTFSIVEARACPQIADRVLPPTIDKCPRRIDALWREQRVLGIDVQRRDTDLGSSTRASLHDPGHLIGSAQEPLDGCHVSFAEGASDARRADRRAVEENGLLHTDGHARCGATRPEHLRRSTPSFPKVEVMPDVDAPRAQAIEDDPIDKALGVELGELSVEGQGDHMIDPKLPQSTRSRVARRHPKALGRQGTEEDHRVWLEGESSGREPCLVRSLDDLGDDRGVARVDPVEVPDRENAARRERIACAGGDSVEEVVDVTRHGAIACGQVSREAAGYHMRVL